MSEVKCRKCGANTTRRTHEGPKPGKTMWYAWYFVCPACRWMLMPSDAVRRLPGPPRVKTTASLSPRRAKTTWQLKQGHIRAENPPQTDAYRHQDAGDDGLPPW